MRNTRRTLAAGLVTATLLLVLSGCQKEEGPLEQAGKKMDQAADKVGQELEKAGNKLQDASQGDRK